MSDNRDKNQKRHVMPDHFEKVSVYVIKEKVIKINSYYLGNSEHVSMISYLSEVPKTGIHRLAIVQGDGQWFSPIDTHIEYKLDNEMRVTDFNYIRTPHPVSPKCAEDADGKQVYVCYITLQSNSSARPRVDFRSLNSDFAGLGFKLSERTKRGEADRPGSSASNSKPRKQSSCQNINNVNTVNNNNTRLGSRKNAYEVSATSKELGTVVATTPVYRRFHKLGEYACLATRKNPFGNKCNNAKFGTNTIIVGTSSK
jgi:hypothetical protein